MYTGSRSMTDSIQPELPDVGKTFKQGDDMAVVESVKAASDVYAPISGEIIEANTALVDEPAKVNEDAEGAAWCVKIKASDAGELDAMMDEAAYASFKDDA